jgi:membrane peptidoglycan carboxypeptidase
VAGKTGTTTDNVSAWFVGYTPQLSAAVAFHRDDNAPLQDILGYGEVTGGTLPALVWKAFMDAALAGTPVETFPSPSFVGEPKNPRPIATPTPTVTATARPTTRPTARPTLRPTASPTTVPTATAGPSATSTPDTRADATGPPGG